MGNVGRGGEEPGSDSDAGLTIKRQVVITGIGAITACGRGHEALWRDVYGGRSAVGYWPEGEAAGLSVKLGAQVRDFDPSQYVARNLVKRLDRSAQFALAAATLALADARLSPEQGGRDRAGVVDGSSLGSLGLLVTQMRKSLAGDRLTHGPSLLVCGMSGNSSGAIAMQFGFRGPAVTVSHGSVSSTSAIGLGLRAIERGDLDVVMAGGTEAPFYSDIVRPFGAAGVLSRSVGQPEQACRPYSLERDGFVLGEGAVYLVLEELHHALARGAGVYCRLAGFAETCDAFHPTSPDPEGKMLAEAITRSLVDANLSADAIGYANLHGTGTTVNDPAECRAVRRAFGESANGLICGSTKPVTGHLLGACGALEAAVVAMALQYQQIPPSLNSRPRDPECDLTCAGPTGSDSIMEAALSVNSSFGGRNACLVFHRGTATARHL